MLELLDYFEPVDASLKTKYKGAKGFIGSEVCFDYDLEEQFIVLIGINEARNSYDSSFVSNSNQIREWLYQLAFVKSNYKIVDLGDLKLGVQVKDTYSSLRYVVETLVGKGIIPVFFGGSHELTNPIVEGLRKVNKKTNALIIDSRADFLSNEEFHSNSFLHALKKNSSKDIDIALMAYQSYFVSNNQLSLLNKLEIDTIRLGKVRSSMKEVEPYFRDSDIVSFDMTSIRFPDFAASKMLSPNGLYAEEGCQLASFAGLSDRLKAFYVSGIDSSKDNQLQSAHLGAQIIWHTLFGISQRKGDYPTSGLDKYKKIYITMDRTNTDLVFYKNEQNNRYWVEIPLNNGEKEIMSCSENDYKEICNNIIPKRIWRKITQYLK